MSRLPPNLCVDRNSGSAEASPSHSASDIGSRCLGEARADADALYDLAPVERVRPVALPQSVKTLVYRSPREDPGAVDLYFPNRVMDLYAPLGLIGGSIIVELVAIVLFQDHFFVELISLPTALMRIGLHMIVGTAVMLAGIFLAARWRGIAFGPFWSALLKLGAISLAPNAVMMLLMMPLAFISIGVLIVWLIGFAIYFALIGALFDLDSSDTWFCVIVIFIVRMGMLFVVAMTGLGFLGAG